MPEAIATTKRKFYKALDALTTSAPVHSTSAKRPANVTLDFERARERVKKRLRQSTSSSSLVELDHNSSATSLPRNIHNNIHGSRAYNGDPSTNHPPNFSPWSHETFLARLKTFSSVSQWHPKPDAIGEVEWVKRGWVCVHVNTVACRGGCEKRVVVGLDSSKPKQRTDRDVANEASKTNSSNEVRDTSDDEDGAEALEVGLIERYKGLIIDGHSGTCLWRRAGCKDDIYRLPIVRPSVWQLELRQRFHSLLKIGDAIELVKTKPSELTGPTVPTPEKLLTELPKDVLGQYQASRSASQRAIEIAMHGWHGSSISGNQLLHCDACFQRIGLWMYQHDYRPTRSSASDIDEQSSTLDLVELHRDHCPWRNPQTQKVTGSLSGLNACQILQRVAATCVRDHRRRSDQHADPREIEPDGESADETTVVETPVLSREEVARRDKERESRLQKLKSLFSVKRRSKVAPVKGAVS